VACPAQVKGRLVQYASRAAMDIDGLGGDTARRL
jgi:NAD-dependent DNA ligase